MHRAVKFSIVLLISLSYYHFSSAGYYVVNNDSAAHAPFRLDLTNIIGVPWVLLEPPPHADVIPNYHTLSPDDGYAVVSSERAVNSFWKMSGGQWSQVELPNTVSPTGVYALDKNDIWLDVTGEIQRKDNLMHYDGKEWKLFETPNSDDICDMDFTSSRSGWAGCVWGQIMHFDGVTWDLLSCPVPYHVARLYMCNDTLGYAYVDRHNLALKYYQSRWQIYYPLIATVEQIFVHVNASSIHDESDLFEATKNFGQADHSESVPSDTLQLSISRRTLIWCSWNSAVRFIDGAPRADFHNAKAGAIVLIFPENRLITGEGWIFLSFWLFSKQKLERRLVLKVPADNLPGKRYAKFNHHPGRETSAMHGVCVGDFDANGVEDYYAIQTYSANHLVLFTEENTAIEKAAEVGVAGSTSFTYNLANYDEGTSCADIENDGDQDILATSLYGAPMLFTQITRTSYRQSSQELHLPQAPGRAYSGIWGDVNNDGYLDLFLSVEDSTNFLLINNGAGVFADRTTESGLYVHRGGVGSSFGDIDNDGDLDLFVPRYGVRNLLYRNEGLNGINDWPLFVEIGREHGVAGADTLARSSCGIFGDVDNDGDLDLFVTNLTSSNRLYLNDGLGRFQDATLPSGLQDRALSQTAVFFDADNDTDLDLYVGNRGASVYYENQGNATFLDKTLEANAGYEGFVTGLVAFDWANDGRIGLYIGDDFRSSIQLGNSTAKTGYLKIRLRGSKSNRDAIGAKVLLYDAGHLGEKQHLLGMREVNGGCGFNSMNSRIAHFGIPDGQPKDALVIFPSGIRREVRNLQPNETHVIYEEDGWARRISCLQKWYTRTAMYPVNQRQALFVTAFLLCILLGNILVLKKFWWRLRVAVFSFWLPIGAFVLLFLALRERTILLSHVLPLVFGSGALSFGLFNGRRIYGQTVSQLEFSEKLFLATNAFFHGEWGARKLNRLQLYCANLDAGAALSSEIKEKFAEAINDFYYLIVPEVERIISYAKAAGLVAELNHASKSHLLTLTSLLNQLSVGMRTLKGLEVGNANSAVEQIQLLQTSLRSLRNSVAKQFTCDVHEIVLKAMNSQRDEDVKMQFNPRVPPGIRARLRPSDCSQMIENLISNAKRAVMRATEKTICVTLDANVDMVSIQVADSGGGVPSELQGKLFQQQVSTKGRAGGFGLYHAHQLLQKYGGSVRLLRSEAQRGSLFEILLKRVDNA